MDNRSNHLEHAVLSGGEMDKCLIVIPSNAIEIFVKPKQRVYSYTRTPEEDDFGLPIFAYVYEEA